MTMSAPEARELLNLQPGYEKADLSSAYRRLVRSVHPDLLVGASEDEVRSASDRLAEVNLANEVLLRSLRLNASDPAPADLPVKAETPFAAAAASGPTYSAPAGGRAAAPRRRWFGVHLGR